MHTLKSKIGTATIDHARQWAPLVESAKGQERRAWCIDFLADGGIGRMGEAAVDRWINRLENRLALLDAIRRQHDVMGACIDALKRTQEFMEARLTQDGILHGPDSRALEDARDAIRNAGIVRSRVVKQFGHLSKAALTKKADPTALKASPILTKTKERVIGTYYIHASQQCVDVCGPDPSGFYYAWNLHQERREAGPMTLAKANAHIRERGGTVYEDQRGKAEADRLERESFGAQ